MSDHSNESDDEAPEQLSFTSTKNIADVESKLVNEIKKRDKEKVKEKRRLRQDMFKQQKLEKESRLSKLVFTDEVLDQIRKEAELNDSSRITSVDQPGAQSDPISMVLPDSQDLEPNSIQETPNLRKRKSTKTYRDLNIEVMPINHIQNLRREAANSFKLRRFGKVHRESVQMNQIHAEKLKVAGKL